MSIEQNKEADHKNQLKIIIDDIHFIKQSFLTNAQQIEKVNLHAESLEKNYQNLKNQTRKELKENMDVIINELQSLGKQVKKLEDFCDTSYKNSPIYKELNDKISNLKIASLNENCGIHKAFISDLEKINEDSKKEIESLKNQINENQMSLNTFVNSVDEYKEEVRKKDDNIKQEIEKIKDQVQDGMIKK
jgi:chromosome segregation ATPase